MNLMEVTFISNGSRTGKFSIAILIEEFKIKLKKTRKIIFKSPRV